MRDEIAINQMPKCDVVAVVSGQNNPSTTFGPLTEAVPFCRFATFPLVGESPFIRTKKRLRIGYNSESFSTKSDLTRNKSTIVDEIATR